MRYDDIIIYYNNNIAFTPHETYEYDPRFGGLRREPGKTHVANRAQGNGYNTMDEHKTRVHARRTYNVYDVWACGR